MKEIKNKSGDIYQIISKGNSLSLAAKLNESLEAKTFIEMALEDDDVLKLLCTHRSTLSVIEKFNFPLLFSIHRNTEVKSELPFATLAKKEGIKGQHTIEHIVERAKPTLENIGNKFQKKYGKLLQDIDTKVEVVGLQEEKDQQIVSMIISQVIIQDIGNEEKILEIIKELEDFVIDDIVPVGLILVDSFKEKYIGYGIKHREKIMSGSKSDEREYENTINRLKTKYKIIKPLISIFWCENETHEHYSFFVISHSNIPTIKCPICDKELSSGTFYYFIPQINYLLRGGEGLIQALTMYIIDKTGRQWLPGVYLEGKAEDTEKDIVIQTSEQKYTIIEIKSFATDVGLRTIKENIKKLMNQAIKHLNSYNDQNIDVEGIYLISNYFIDKEIKSFAKELLSNSKFENLKKIKLKIVGLNNIKELNELKFEPAE